MKPYLSTLILLLFIGTALTEFYAEAVYNKQLVFLTKPLLLPLIAAYYISKVNGRWNRAHKWMIPAFFFSWIGDISLMLTPEHPEDLMIMGIAKNKYYFFIGLGGFLMAHLFFIRAYLLSIKDKSTTLFQTNRIPFIPIIVYWAVMLYIIVPAIAANEEKSQAVVPVIIYASILAAMTIFAINRYRQVNTGSFWLVLVGSISFLISDSVIAINFLVFERPLPPLSFVIITTYVLAEFCIAIGILKEYHQL